MERDVVAADETHQFNACTPVPCPTFEETTLQVARCPACGTSQLKWHLDQRFECANPFHDTGIANPRRVKLDPWLLGS